MESVARLSGQRSPRMPRLLSGMAQRAAMLQALGQKRPLVGGQGCGEGNRRRLKARAQQNVGTASAIKRRGDGSLIEARLHEEPRRRPTALAGGPHEVDVAMQDVAHGLAEMRTIRSGQLLPGRADRPLAHAGKRSKLRRP